MDLTFNWGEPLDVPIDDLARLLATSPPGSLVIGRRLEPRELDRLQQNRADCDAETYALLIPDDRRRWGRGRRRG